jgi:Fuc2NAc and GlcNAc transferase
MSWLILFLTCPAAAAWITGLLRRYALRAGIIDIPNQRSSHSAPTPRGGGLAIVIVTLTGTGLLCWMGLVRGDLLIALAGGGAAVAAVGFVDDRRQLPARARLTVHVAAAAWAVVWVGGLPPVPLGGHFVMLGWAGSVLGVVGIVWVLNLFNFMDGIDALAATEAMFVTWGAAVLAVVSGSPLSVAAAASIMGAASGGFLWWNWPPARIFMGDVGSGYVGYTLAVLALAAGSENTVSLWTWLILGGVFFIDATVTLVRRALHGERVHQAHRNHAYQRLARRWQSHRRVTIGVMLINLLWLFPCATLAKFEPRWAGRIVVVALVPLVVVAFVAGAGRRESQDTVTG